MREQSFLTIDPQDSVEVAISETDGIPFGHKRAKTEIKKGETIFKYGFPIGHASRDIHAGEHVHGHNMVTNLGGTLEYQYQEQRRTNAITASGRTFSGYRRKSGAVGIRNDIWIVPTVGCVNGKADQIARKARQAFGAQVFALCHPYGCSQMGDDQMNTQKVLAALVNHPNAGAVLVLSLGCENNNLEQFIPYLGNYDQERIRFVAAQDEKDEVIAALRCIWQLLEITKQDKRVSIPQSELIIGFKCGGSDAFSGISANPLCGRFTDLHTQIGGRAILTEVPEMFGAEQILMERALNEEVFRKTVRMVNRFKDYYLSHHQVIYENPSPGNKKGGITTLEEKSLGCIQKGGSAVITDVLAYAQPCVRAGLSLLEGPGNDMVSCTNLAASGAHMILFTTGRGTPLGAPVPTVKIASNSVLADKKENWIDFDAGTILENADFDGAVQELLDLVIDVASGRKTKNEENDDREIAVFKNGVTL